MRKLILALILTMILFILHYTGINGLYYYFNYLDIVNHILGGMIMALIVGIIIDRYFANLNNKNKIIFWSVVIIGIVWEIFEAYFGISGYPFLTNSYNIDTVKDLVDDAIGALLIIKLIF